MWGGVSTLNIVSACLLFVSFWVEFFLSHLMWHYGEEMRDAINDINKNAPDFDYWRPGWKEHRIYLMFKQLGLHKQHVHLYKKYRLAKLITIMNIIVWVLLIIPSVPVILTVINHIIIMLKK